MAEEFSLSIDTDWKKQAQEEKRRLAEQAAKQAPPAAPAIPPSASAVAPRGGTSAARGRRELPQASFATLVNSLLSQTLLYLGDLAFEGTEGAVNLDRAKYQVDTLGILEEKTANNLTPDEQHALDSALYEARTRFVSMASQYI